MRLHPDGQLYVGDLVSLEIIPPEWAEVQGKKVSVRLGDAASQPLGETSFGRYGIGGRQQATLLWVWDASGLEAGEHELVFTVQPDGQTWRESVRLLSREQVPPPEPQARWEMAQTGCCQVNYISGTSVERDLPDLLAMVDAQAKDASQKLGVQIDKPLSITFLPRVLGHGGFASGELAVSYLDRNYAGGVAATILHHEMVHELDARLGGEFRPTLLLEGLAVYLSGGHFKPEPLMPRAAALLSPSAQCEQASSLKGHFRLRQSACGLNWYLPLRPLIDDFYTSQHEIGYLEAGALVEFMVKTWGWQAFSDFYRDIHPPEASPETGEDGSQSSAMDAALQDHFGISLDELEERYLAALRQERLTTELVEDVRLTVGYYDTMRRYQQVLDPSAYFLTAWLPDAASMREKGIVADYLRRPSQPENLAIEAMLVAADADLRAGDYIQSEELLVAVHMALSGIQRGDARPFDSYPLAADYLSVVQAVQAAGYQPEKIEIDENIARVQASTDGQDLIDLSLTRGLDGWKIAVELSGCIDLCRRGFAPPAQVCIIPYSRGMSTGSPAH